MASTINNKSIFYGRSLNDGETGQGSVNSVKRFGDSVVRPLGPWSSAVHGLLNHLNAVGFRYAPKVLSADHEQKTETLSYIDGEAAMRPWPPCLLGDDGIKEIALMLREYHNVVADYVPESGAVWRVPDVHWKEGMIVRHADLGPWNMIWMASDLVGLIDWDMAEPGYPIEDVAQVAWYCLPLRTPERCSDAGVESALLNKRLSVLCQTYDVDADLVLNALVQLQKKEIERTIQLGQAGVNPWQFFMQRGDVADINEDMSWLLETYEIK